MQDLKPSRSEKAGIQLGLSIIEVVNLMYQNATAMRFLKGLSKTILSEIKLRVVKIKEEKL